LWHPDKSQTVTLSNDPVKSQAINVEVFPGDTIGEDAANPLAVWASQL
jgi:hypothetical protein